MKSFLFSIIAIAVIGIVGFNQPAQATSLNNFTISNYDMQMKLSRGDDNRSRLETIETITAQFSKTNTNHGIERSIPSSYDGHSTSLKIISVKDESGKDREYSTNESNDNTVLRIGNPDTFAHGEQTYVIRYSQRDVTRHFSDTSKDEFYWDTNGTQWKVPIDNLSVSVRIDPLLEPSLNGEDACYDGRYESKAKCELFRVKNSYTMVAKDLAPGGNVTVALGFKENTFSEYQLSTFERILQIWYAVLGVTAIISVVLVIWFLVRAWRLVAIERMLKPIIPEYLPPKGTSVTAAASIALNASGSTATAQLLDLAVRHYIKLYETKQKKLLKPAEYEIEIIKSLEGLYPEEQELLRDMFNKLPDIGARLNLKDLQSSHQYYKRTLDNDKKLQKLLIEKYKLKRIDEGARRWFKRAASYTIIGGVLSLSPVLLLTSLIALSLAYMIYPLTNKGIILRRYLEGLKLYISVAEVKRLEMLQGAEGSEKVVTEPGGDERKLIKLYERVLPYAVLFNQEKTWTKNLGKYYDLSGVQPDWYVGRASFNAAVFSSSIASFSQASAYSAGASSSSSGSSGGGFSGGGGGGGGGGGW